MDELLFTKYRVQGAIKRKAKALTATFARNQGKEAAENFGGKQKSPEI